MRDTERKCCSASTSVGAISAPWNPVAAADNSAARATTVLPLPTSPWSRRFIGGAPRFMSLDISSMQRDCAPVRLKGNEPRKFPTIPAGGSTLMPAISTLDSRRRPSTAICSVNSSSKARRDRAAIQVSSSSGKWAWKMASRRGISPASDSAPATSSGRVSSTPPSQFCSASQVNPRRARAFRPSVSGCMGTILPV